MGNCAGVDWASAKHDVIVAEESGEEAARGDVCARRPEGLVRCAARWCG